MRVLLAVLLSAVALVAGSPLAKRDFDPYTYQLSTTKCSAVDHATGATKQINLEYLSINPKANRTIVFVHGWPSLWTVWWPQIVEFSDYHLIVPNLRGFGNSGFVGSAKTTGTFFDIANDLNCLLQAEKVSKAVCVGHDWGSQVCLETAIFYPNKILAASGTIPYQPNTGTYTPVWFSTPLVPQLGYQVYFNNYTTQAVTELNKDIRTTIRSTYKTATDPLPDTYLLSQTDYLGCWGNKPIPPSLSLLSVHQEDYLHDHLAIQGFGNNLYFYQNANRVLDHDYTLAHGGPTVHQPVLFLPPAADGVVKDFVQFMNVLGAYQFVPNSQTVILNNTGHWVTLEVPDAYNFQLRTWLQNTVFA